MCCNLVYWQTSLITSDGYRSLVTGTPTRTARNPMRDDTLSYLPMRALDFSILVALAEDDLYGYAIVKRIADREVGAVRLAPGNLYNVLDRLIDAGLIEPVERIDPEDERRRYYGITALGRRVATAEAARLRAVVRTADRLGLAEGRAR